jgi:hypothetical protein
MSGEHPFEPLNDRIRRIVREEMAASEEAAFAYADRIIPVLQASALAAELRSERPARRSQTRG